MKACRQADSVDELDRPHVDYDTGLEANPLRILLLDDNEDAASMLTMLLGASGHQVMVEHFALKTLDRAKQDVRVPVG